MIKKIFLILILLLVTGAAAIYFFGSSALNNGIKNGVETFGPKVTQTPVTLESVSISPSAKSISKSIRAVYSATG
jgi:uncharacterized membrane protein HdeD (DUF308 family)